LNVIAYIFVFLFGAAIGSFLNVVMFRLPKGISIVRPHSFCPHCKKPIPWYENIPIVGYMYLGGKCSGCRKPISIHYPIIESLMGCLLLYLFISYGLAAQFFFYMYLFCSLIIIAGIDFSYQIIPDIISIPGIAIGLVFQIITNNFILGLIGALFGGGLILLLRVIGGWVYKKEVMGMGDVYLTAMIGAFVGFPLIIASIFIAALAGAILGVIYVISTHQSRESPIPFGPFLGFGGIAVLVFNTQIIQFFRLLGINL